MSRIRLTELRPATFAVVIVVLFLLFLFVGLCQGYLKILTEAEMAEFTEPTTVETDVDTVVIRFSDTEGIGQKGSGIDGKIFYIDEPIQVADIPSASNKDQYITVDCGNPDIRHAASLRLQQEGYTNVHEAGVDEVFESEEIPEGIFETAFTDVPDYYSELYGSEEQ